MRYTLLLLGLLSAVPALAQRMSINYITPSIVRVQYSADTQLHDNGTGICVYSAEQVPVEQEDLGQKVRYSSSELIIEWDKQQWNILFLDAKTQKQLLYQPFHEQTAHEKVVQEHVVYDEKSAHTEHTANGDVTVRDIIRRDTIGVSTRYRAFFEMKEDEAIYGLGSHMEDYLNLQGKTLYLTQHNLKAFVPMVVSTKGYGLLFDAGCAMKWSSRKSDWCKPGDVPTYGALVELDAAKELDYYFIKGSDMEGVVAGYRYLTGEVSLMPRWLFGYTQSKERYCSSNELIGIVREYRRRHVPLDMVVQDWNYWPQGWGYMKMDPKYYPDPKALADSIHAMNAKLMVSIWPNPQWCPEAEDFKQHGYMLPNDVYDVFNPEARKYYWKYANDEFFARGFDAWWCDSSEPLDGDWNRIPGTQPDGKPYSWEHQEKRWELNKEVLSQSLGIERSSLYSLYHSRGIYENQRATGSQKRVVNLTRSTYAGQQRYGTVVWNGDTHASWQSFRQQIPSGLNYMATGNPYWTVDVGSFFTRGDGRRWFYQGAFPGGAKSEAYREYYLRMFQWATFLPMLRSHGSDTPREIWQFGEPGTPYYEGILRMIRLRYRLIPYIYSKAAEQHFGSYTLARPLAFDFAQDRNVWDLKDEYMFGDLLVCPITSPMSEQQTRRVYLPAGASWTDFWTHKNYEGGQWIEVPVELQQLPLYVRQGTILTTTEVTEYSEAQLGLPITLKIWPGADGSMLLYEDAGDGYGFEQGEYVMTEIRWDDQKRTLSLSRKTPPATGKMGHMKESKADGMRPRVFFVELPDGTSKTLRMKGKTATIRL